MQSFTHDQIQRILAILVLVPLFFSACTREDSVVRAPGLEIPEITGYFLRDHNGVDMGTIGTPNVKLGSGPNLVESDYFFMVYPNPAYHQVALYSKSPSGNSVRRIWIVEAVADHSAAELTESFNSINLVVGGTPLAQTVTTTENASLNIESLEPGYYRIYLEIDDLQLFDNLVVADPSPELHK